MKEKTEVFTEEEANYLKTTFGKLTTKLQEIIEEGGEVRIKVSPNTEPPLYSDAEIPDWLK